MSVICVNELPGMGTVCKEGNPFAGIYGLIFTIPSFEFDTVADFADLDEYEDAIAGGEIFPVMGIKEDEDTTPDDVIWEGPYGDKVFITEGRNAKTYRMILTHDQHKRLREYNGKKFRLLKVDRNGNIKGTLKDSGKVAGFNISFMRIGKMVDPTADAPAMTAIMIEESDPKQWNEKGIYVTPSWLPSEEIQPLTEVTATPSTAAANIFTVAVAFNGGYDGAGAAISIPISGLVVGNFNVINDSGVEVTPTGVEESATAAGLYTVTCSAFTSGTVQVVGTAAALYRSDIEAVAAA